MGCSVPWFPHWRASVRTPWPLLSSPVSESPVEQEPRTKGGLASQHAGPSNRELRKMGALGGGGGSCGSPCGLLPGAACVNSQGSLS